MTLSRQNNKFKTWKTQQTCNKVYEAIYYLTGGESIERRKVSVKEIRDFMQEQTKMENEELEKLADQKCENGEIDIEKKEEYIKKGKKKALSQRVIERCLEDRLKDPRIVKDGSKYFISDRERFEYEFEPISFDPHEFGLAIHDTIFGSFKRIPIEERTDSYYKEELNDFVVKIGCFIIFAMIEVAKPFRYQPLSPREGEDLVYYWLNNIIPINEIFTNFRVKFDERKPYHNWKTPISEMNESIINQLMKTMQELYPDIYKRYIFGKRNSSGKNFENDI